MKLLLLILLILNVGCTRTSLILKYADTFIAYEIKDQFELSGNQKDQAEDLSTEIVSDLKKEFLPKLSEMIRAIPSRLEKAPSEEVQKNIETLWQEFESHGKTLYPLIQKKIPAFAQLLKENNWTEFKNNFSEKNKDILKPRENKRSFELAERFLGRLTEPQKQLLIEFQKNGQGNSERRVNNRNHVLSRFEKEMGPFSSENFERTSLAWLSDKDLWNNPESTTYWQNRRQQTFVLLTELWKTLTDDQKKRLASETSALAKDIETFSLDMK